MKTSNFKIWLQKFWLEHQREVEAWTGKPVPYTKREYFGKYRWWIKTVYKKGKHI